jgi:hypothetical protein
VQTQNDKEDTMKKLSDRYAKLSRVGALLFATALAFAVPAALAQVPSSVPPYNVDLGVAPNAPLIRNTLQVPATVNAAQQTNLDKLGAICTLVTTALSGSPSVTFLIQNFDSASGLYYTAVTSGAISAPTINTPYNIAIRPGLATVAAGTTPPVVGAAGFALSRFWRLQEVITGANTAVTGTISCNMIK